MAASPPTTSPFFVGRILHAKPGTSFESAAVIVVVVVVAIAIAIQKQLAAFYLAQFNQPVTIANKQQYSVFFSAASQ